jgi:hypothetical protein
MNSEAIEQLFTEAKNDPELFSTIDVNELLNALHKDSTDYLENKTLQTISDEIYNVINGLGLTPEKTRDWCHKLIGYRLVNEVYELHKGKTAKTIRLYEDGPPKLIHNGIVLNIVFLDNGTHVRCRNPQFTIMQYKFNERITFQQLSTDEQLILMAYEHISKKNH